MKINEDIKKCVAFLQIKLANDTYQNIGTCFFVLIQINENSYGCAVTAKHVLDGAEKKLGLDEVYIRLNLKHEGTESVKLKIVDWIISKDNSIDIAICNFSFPENNNYDHLYYLESSFMTDKLIEDNEIGCGDEVFITGLFKHHSGVARNSPIIRTGNIALFPSEKINLQYTTMDAFLIEARSIGGLSGSPVFVNLGVTRRLNGQTKHATNEPIPPLFGLIHGHFDEDSEEIDAIKDITNEQKKVNVGIAIVTPAAKLLSMLNDIKMNIKNRALTNLPS